MNNYYENSWKFYKASSSVFTGDLDYYKNFVGNKPALELFAGYGRITNYLLENGASDIYTVELEKDFSKDIKLPDSHKFIGDILTYQTSQKYARIFAGYDSFPLLAEEKQIYRFFNLLDNWLAPQGLISLSYYHPDHWAHPAYTITVDNKEWAYNGSFNLEDRPNKKGVWIDNYADSQDHQFSFEYPVRIYEDENDLIPFLKNTNLSLKDIVFDYNNKDCEEGGWVEYILTKDGLLL